MTSIASAVARFKDNPQFHLNHRTVWQACDDVGYTWRDRQLDPVTTIQLFIAQVLHGNVACRTLRHVAGLTCSAAAYCKARARLPLDVFGLIVQQVTHAARETTNDIGRWRGHRLFYVDGTGVSMPDTPALAQAFGYPGSVKPGCGFPVMHGLFLFDAATGLIVDLVFSHGHTHDAAVATRVHPSLEPGDVLLGDRAFDSFTHLAWLIDEGIEALCRVHQRRIVDFKQGRAEVFHKDGDYDAFVRLIGLACERQPMRVLAYCLMPNHFHLALQPYDDGDLSQWMQWLTTSHVRRYHRHYHSSGHVWQGRFKSFPVEDDDHLWIMLRYVERNALRADLVERAQAWPWSSLRWWRRADRPAYLCDGPFDRPTDWVRRVNRAETDSELAALRGCGARGTPFGTQVWQRRVARRLRLESTLRPRGRPRLSRKK